MILCISLVIIVIARLVTNVSSSDINCGCVVDGGYATTAFRVLSLYYVTDLPPDVGNSFRLTVHPVCVAGLVHPSRAVSLPQLQVVQSSEVSYSN